MKTEKPVDVSYKNLTGFIKMKTFRKKIKRAMGIIRTCYIKNAKFLFFVLNTQNDYSGAFYFE